VGAGSAQRRFIVLYTVLTVLLIVLVVVVIFALV
jgi:hypothetical protein